jgi:dephospho-CoA kinase
MLVGIVGKKGSGKTSIAKILCEEFSYLELSFAQPLKEIGRVFGFTDQQLHEDKLEVNEAWGICAREFLQKFGTELCREKLPSILPQMNNVWIQLMERRIEAQDRPIVISDVRFKDEAQLIHRKLGFIIRVERELEEDGYSVHSSEVEQLGIRADYVIQNNSTMEVLRYKVRQAIYDLNVLRYYATT